MMMDDQAEFLLNKTLPHVSAQVRMALTGLQLALERVSPPEGRDSDAELDENTAVMEQSYYRLLRLSKNLEQAALLNRQEPLQTENMDLVVWLEELIHRAVGLFALQRIGLVLRCEERHCIIAVNCQRLSQALWHLLSNALRFTPEGGTVTVSLAARGQHVLLEVQDTGSGVPPEEQTDLFRRYVQPDRLETLAQGFGLGLPVAQKIAQLHGGQLFLSSRQGEGTRVTLTLPRKRTQGEVKMPCVDYTGGYQEELVELSDGLPSSAFRIRHLDR